MKLPWLRDQRGSILLFTTVLVVPLMIIFGGLAMDLAYHGTVLCGYATNPSGQTEAWFASSIEGETKWPNRMHVIQIRVIWPASSPSNAKSPGCVSAWPFCGACTGSRRCPSEKIRMFQCGRR